MFPEAEVYHFQGKSAEKEKKRAKVEYFRSRYHFFKKNKGNLQWFILLIGLLIRLGFELLSMAVASLVTFFTIKGWRKKLSIYAYLFWWHLRLCPGGHGVEGNKPMSNDKDSNFKRELQGFNGHETRTRNTI